MKRNLENKIINDMWEDKLNYLKIKDMRTGLGACICQLIWGKWCHENLDWKETNVHINK